MNADILDKRMQELMDAHDKLRIAHYNCTCTDDEKTVTPVSAGTDYCTCEHDIVPAVNAQTDYCTCGHEEVNPTQTRLITLEGKTDKSSMERAGYGTLSKASHSTMELKEMKKAINAMDIKYKPPSGLSMFHLPIDDDDSN